MPDTCNDVDVLIVGAGPVGLFLANECARRGLRFRVVEKNAGQSQHSKALAIFPRTLEIFDMAGVVAPFLEQANRVTSVTIIAQGRRLALMPFQPQESPYPFIAMVPQDVTERFLVESLARRGGVIEYETAFVSASERPGGAHITLDHNGATSSMTASYVVGCDGAHSAIRHLLNLPFEGAAYEHTFMLADIETNDALPADQLQLCPSELGPVAIFPMSATRRRIVAIVHQTEGDSPSLELVRRVLAERAPRGLEARSLYWSSYFRIHHRQVTKMRSSRFFVAGDAAHIHSPFGGQGMNTGLQDVWNLAWKLDMVLREDADEALLDSYSKERRPVIKQVIETTDFLTRAMGTPSKLAQLLRDTVIPVVSRLAPFQHAFVQRLSELGIAYHGSPIVEGAGERFWGDSLRGGERIKSRFLLIIGVEREPAIKEEARVLCDEHSSVVELCFSPGNDLKLVRPDGYLAFSAHDRQGTAALSHIRSLLQHQTKRHVAA